MLAGVASSISYVPHAPATASRDGARHRPPAMQLQGGSSAVFAPFVGDLAVLCGSAAGCGPDPRTGRGAGHTVTHFIGLR